MASKSNVNISDKKRRDDALEIMMTKAGGEDVDDDDCIAIGFQVVEAAMEYFVECPEDFCLQNMSGETIVFGGTNRLLWTARHGFRPDRSSCTEKFLRHYVSMGDLPRR